MVASAVSLDIDTSMELLSLTVGTEEGPQSSLRNGENKFPSAGCPRM